MVACHDKVFRTHTLALFDLIMGRKTQDRPRDKGLVPAEKEQIRGNYGKLPGKQQRRALEIW